MWQHETPFSCPDCGEHTFETDAVLRSEKDFVDANCTNCGYVLSGEDIASQSKDIPAGELQKLLAR